MIFTLPARPIQRQRQQRWTPMFRFHVSVEAARRQKPRSRSEVKPARRKLKKNTTMNQSFFIVLLISHYYYHFNFSMVFTLTSSNFFVFLFCTFHLVAISRSFNFAVYSIFTSWLHVRFEWLYRFWHRPTEAAPRRYYSFVDAWNQNWQREEHLGIKPRIAFVLAISPAIVVQLVFKRRPIVFPRSFRGCCAGNSVVVCRQMEGQGSRSVLWKNDSVYRGMADHRTGESELSDFLESRVMSFVLLRLRLCV